MSVAKLNEQLCFALYSASNHLTSIYRPLLKPLNLTYTQFIVLMALWEEDAISISQLAKKTKLSKATMTPLLKRLEQKKLVQRLILPENERQKSIELTDVGRRLSKKSLGVTKQAFAATKLSPKEAKNLISLCQKMVNS